MAIGVRFISMPTENAATAVDTLRRAAEVFNEINLPAYGYPAR
jgi:hypothetical protein